MKSKSLLVGLAVCALITNGVMANEVYKWTDKDGNVHYEDRPSAQAKPEVIALSYSRTNPDDVRAQKQGLADNLAAREESKAQQAEAEQAAAAEAAKQAKRQSKCESYRAKLESFVTSRRLYRTDKNGERVYLDDDDIQETRTRAEELVAKYCTP